MSVTSTPARQNDTPLESSRPARSLHRFIPLLTLLLLLTRAATLYQPHAIDDEQVYAVVAREMLAGGRPYLDAVERKPPLLFVVFAAVLRAGGQSDWLAIHAVSLLWTLATMAGLFAIGRRLFDRRSAWMAALLYGVFQLWADYRNLSLNGELLMNLPIVLAYWLAFLPTRRPWRPELFLSGLLIAVAFLLKQPAGIAGAPLGLYVLLPRYREDRGLGWLNSLVHAAELATGFAAGLLLAYGVLKGYGILGEAVYWTLLAHRDPVGPTHALYWVRFTESTGFFLLESAPLWIAGIVSLTPSRRRLWTGRHAERACLVLLLAVSVLGVSVNGQFLYHYYLQLLPALALLAAPVLTGQLLGPSARARPLAALLVFLLCLFAVVDLVGLARHRRASASAEWVKAHSAAEDRLFVWGQGDGKTGMYLDAERRPATRFISPFPLTGHVFGGYPPEWGETYEERHALPGAWDTLAIDFARHPPRFVIDAEVRTPGTRYPVARYPRLEHLLQGEYRVAAVLPDGVVYERVP